MFYKATAFKEERHTADNIAIGLERTPDISYIGHKALLAKIDTICSFSKKRILQISRQLVIRF